MRIADECFERANVLVVKLGGVSDEILFAGFGAPGGVDQAIGDAAHGRDHGYARILLCRVRNNLGGPGDT